MVLGDDFHSIEIGEYGDIGMLLHSFNQAGLYLCARIVLVVQDAELGVAAFLMQVEFSTLFLVEVHSPLDELVYLFGGVAYNFLYGFAVADPVACNHGVFDMLFKIVYFQIGD